MTIAKYAGKIRFTDGVLLAALVLVGGFHEYISCALSVAMCIYLLLRLKNTGTVTVGKNFLTVAVTAVCLAYGVTCFWAVDRGMALVGFVKFLPLLLYLLCLQQQDNTTVLTTLPYVAAGLAVICGIGMQFAPLKALFSVAGRLAGTFQYPNTFAVVLLVCELLLVKKPGKQWWDYIVLAALVAGLLYTGSRTAFVVAVVANGAMLLIMTKKKTRYISLAVLGGVLLVVAILALIPGSVLRRYLTISLTESTFVGRLLYWQDALALVLKYPFGMGYLGYYYMQQSVQTGVYTVTYIHNDLLQLVLDIGWLPAVLAVVALARWFCSREVPVSSKIIVGAVCLHSLFDFDLQFVGVGFLLLTLLCQDKPGKVWEIKAKLPVKLSLWAVAAVSLYLGASLMLAHFGAWSLADTLCPYNTQNKLAMLAQETDVVAADQLADEILSQNTAFYAPYNIKAKYAYSQGDFGGAIQYMRDALARNPFEHNQYAEYCQILITGMQLYQKAGDLQSAEICRKEALAIYEQLASNADRLSPLGKMIDDQPVLELPQELEAYISALKK